MVVEEAEAAALEAEQARSLLSLSVDRPISGGARVHTSMCRVFMLKSGARRPALQPRRGNGSKWEQIL